MSSIVKIICTSTGQPSPHDGRYVVAWNPHTRYGVLECDSTDDPAKALQFTSFHAAFLEWGAQSSVDPWRAADSRPNKPLTALTIEIMPSPTPGQNTKPGMP